MRQVNLYRAEVKRYSWSKDIDSFTLAASNFDQALDRAKRWHRKAYVKSGGGEVVSITKFETLGGPIVVEKG